LLSVVAWSMCNRCVLWCLFFFSGRRRHTRSKRDWSSDVCSSDLIRACRASGGIARRRNVIESCQTVAAIEPDDRRNNAAAEEPAAVIVYVESEVDSRPKCVRPVNPRDVVHELWRGDRTLCVWRQAVRPVDVQRRSQHTVVSPDGNLLWIRKVGIGLSEGELKREDRKSTRL